MSYNIFFLITLIKSFLFSNSKVIIPFKIKEYKPEKDKDKFILNYFYKDLVIDLSVGTPPQPITLSACLGEYNTFIVSKNCKNYKGVFNEKDSKTFVPKDKSDYYIFEVFKNGTKAKDIFMFGKIKIDDFQFFNALEVDYENCIDRYNEYLAQPGILGFLVQPQNNVDMNFSSYNFINQLKRKNLISRYDFYFTFDSDDSGNIIIGSLPNETEPENYKDKILNSFIVSQGKSGLDWAFKFDEVYLGEEKLDLEYERKSIFRIEFGFIRVTSEMEKYIKKFFFDSLITANKCFRKSVYYSGFQMYYYYCNKDADLNNFQPWKFAINDFEMNFTFTKEDLFLDIGDKYLFLMTFEITATNLILGYPFFKKYNFIFNQDSKTLGYFIKKSEEISKDSIKIPVIYIIIIILVLSIVLIGLGIFAYTYFCVNKKKKKMAKELTEDIEDNPQNKEGLIPNEENN